MPAHVAKAMEEFIAIVAEAQAGAAAGHDVTELDALLLRAGAQLDFVDERLLFLIAPSIGRSSRLRPLFAKNWTACATTFVVAAFIRQRTD